MVFIFKNNLCIVCVFLCTHTYTCVRGKDNFQELDSPFPRVGFRITVHWTWWEVTYPLSHLTKLRPSWFLVRICCSVHSRTDSCPWVLPFCPSRHGAVSMGVDISHCVLVWCTGTQQGLSYSCCPMNGNSQHWHHCWNDAKLCYEYMCAIKPETQRRHHLPCMFPSARDSECWLQFRPLPRMPLFLIRRTDVQVFMCVYPKP